MAARLVPVVYTVKNSRAAARNQRLTIISDGLRIATSWWLLIANVAARRQV